MGQPKVLGLSVKAKSFTKPTNSPATNIASGRHTGNMDEPAADDVPALTGTCACACGSVNFTLTESIIWKATTENGGGRLAAYRVTGNTIDEIVCVNCGATYPEDAFQEIDFS